MDVNTIIQAGKQKGGFLIIYVPKKRLRQSGAFGLFSA
jgi:hypothetical protein